MRIRPAARAAGERGGQHGGEGVRVRRLHEDPALARTERAHAGLRGRTELLHRVTERAIVTGELGERAERRVPERAAAGDLPFDDDLRAAFGDRAHDLVIGQTGLHQQPRLRTGPGREQLGAADEEPQRLRRGAVPRREQLLVEVEVRDERGSAPPEIGAVQRGLGADDDIGGRRHRAGLGVEIDDVLTGQQGRELLADPRHARTDDAQSRLAARGAHDRPFLVLVPPQELVAGVAHEQRGTDRAG